MILLSVIKMDQVLSLTVHTKIMSFCLVSSAQFKNTIVLTVAEVIHTNYQKVSKNHSFSYNYLPLTSFRATMQYTTRLVVFRYIHLHKPLFVTSWLSLVSTTLLNKIFTLCPTEIHQNFRKSQTNLVELKTHPLNIPPSANDSDSRFTVNFPYSTTLWTHCQAVDDF